MKGLPSENRHLIGKHCKGLMIVSIAVITFSVLVRSYFIMFINENDINLIYTIEVKLSHDRTANDFGNFHFLSLYFKHKHLCLLYLYKRSTFASVYDISYCVVIFLHCVYI